MTRRSPADKAAALGQPSARETRPVSKSCLRLPAPQNESRRPTLKGRTPVARSTNWHPSATALRTTACGTTALRVAGLQNPLTSSSAILAIRSVCNATCRRWGLRFGRSLARLAVQATPTMWLSGQALFSRQGDGALPGDHGHGAGRAIRAVLLRCGAEPAVQWPMNRERPPRANVRLAPGWRNKRAISPLPPPVTANTNRLGSCE